MMHQSFEVRIRKEALKFAAAHMTVFPDGTKEPLHGHNYVPTLSVRLGDVSFKNMIEFSKFKVAMKKISLLWDEKILIATENPFFKKVKQSKSSVEFLLCDKRYVLPRDEVIFLKVDNITCETLAEAYLDFLEAELDEIFELDHVQSVTVDIEETPGQGASVTRSLVLEAHKEGRVLKRGVK